jgi:adenylate cyclase
LATIAAIDQAVDIFSSMAADFGGVVLAFTGDGAFATFNSAAAAVRFALAFQDSASEAVGGLKFRIGVHLGEVFEHGERAYGESINIAQRLQSIAPPSAVYVSDAIYRAIRAREEFSFEHLGAQALKGFPDAVDVFRVHGSRVAATLKPSSRPSLMSPLLEERPTPAIAVLPFRDLSDVADQGFFAEGVSDDIITNLCRFRGIDVISRGSSFAFKGAALPVQEVGRRLGARYVAASIGGTWI